MKRFVFLLPALFFLAVSCKQAYFIAEDDVYSSADPVALRPRSGDVKPEASYDGYVYQQENGNANRAGYFDPNSNQNVSGETRVINNYYIYDTPGMGWNGSRYRINRWNRPGVYVSYGWGPSWGYNPWGPSWGYNPWGPSWGYNPWGPSWGPQPWGWNPYGYYHQPWGGPYGMWGSHGGWGNPYAHGWGGYNGNGWGMHSWYSAPAGNSSGFGIGNNGGNVGNSGPRPTFAGNQNPVNMGVGRGNASPIDAGGRPNQQAIVSNDLGARGNNSSVVSSGRDSRPNAASDRNSNNERPVLANGSSPWNPRVDAPARNNGQTANSNNSTSRPSGNNSSSSRPSGSNPGAVTVERGTPNASRPSAPSASPSRPSSPSTSTPNTSRPSGTVSPSPNTNRPTNASPAPSRQPSNASPAPSRQPNTSSPSPSRTPSSSSGSSRPSGGSSGGSIGGGSSGGSSGGGGRSGGSSGGSSGGGGRPR